ncbi:hypothetical protein [Tomitella biformata]|uniref:hypothetical protein n=1 Tax=Tomitella biformata TaxID=630403 RepID=UPI0004641CF9|nr:hypothetical protein [Tomitella biformata]
MAKTQQQHRIGLIIFVVAAAATCLLLGYWQLSRFESATGTAQNLGYAFQWPAFAAFFIYAYRRFIRLEADVDAEQDSSDEDDADADDLAVSPSKPKKKVWVRDKSEMTEIPEYLLPKRASAAAASRSAAADVPGEADRAGRSLSEYNDYLAQLRERDTEGQRR